ncbi:MAG: Fic family protein [Deltaproteobacteria bacterium]|nr:Fic family protein [Deltaproteobacteria bacterium]
MLYTYPALDDDEKRVEAATARIRADLRNYVVTEPRRWTGLLARMTRARALMASNSVEGIHVTDEDAIAAIDGEDPASTDRETWRAVVGYREAMDYILQRRKSTSFRITEDVLLAVHFMICQSDLQAHPGQYRPGWVGIRNTKTGEVVHEGVDRGQLEPLVRELLDYVDDGDVESVFLRAAMTHLNLALLHPFSDGNGRTARCIQTAVLASDGIVAPAFSSIEEYIGHNQQQYYNVLAEVGGGGWNPRRDAKPWVRFCLSGHYLQAQTLLRRTRELERVYAELLNLVESRGLPERTAMALLQAAFGSKVRNSSYRVSADVSNNLASRDLKVLVDTKLIVANGERRGRYYVASPTVAEIRRTLRLPKQADDPFAPDGPLQVPSGQTTLFPVN